MNSFEYIDAMRAARAVEDPMERARAIRKVAADRQQTLYQKRVAADPDLRTRRAAAERERYHRFKSDPVWYARKLGKR